MSFGIKFGFAGIMVSVSGFMLKAMIDDSLVEQAGPFSKPFESLTESITNLCPTLFVISLIIFLLGIASTYSDEIMESSRDLLRGPNTSEPNPIQPANQQRIDAPTAEQTSIGIPKETSPEKVKRKIFI